MKPGDFRRMRMAVMKITGGIYPIHQPNRVWAETETIPLPDVKEKKAAKKKSTPKLIPRFHVVLLDDNDHTYEYVIEMLTRLFGHSRVTAFKMACEVDFTGRVIVYTATKERAEFKRDQIHAYGADWRIPRCQGSMSAILEEAEPEN